jgi:hypothetical protein
LCQHLVLRAVDTVGWGCGRGRILHAAAGGRAPVSAGFFIQP